MNEFGFILCLILILILSKDLIYAYTSIFNESVILSGVNNYCDLYCANTSESITNTISHTLCNASDTIVSKACEKNFYEYDLDQNSLKEDLMDGHNGLRNRIAGKMKVSNMRKLSWDPELSRMASIWIRSCRGLEKDPCTQNLVRKFKSSKSDIPLKIAQNYQIVNQLRTAKRSKFFPPRFISIVLQEWYLEKNLMQPPRTVKSYGSFKISNNFTQLAWADTYRIGCAVARNGEFYILICNYYPYNSPLSQEHAFRYGKPVTLCPNMAPLQDVKFQNLCTGDDRGHRIEGNLIAIIFFVLIIALN